MDLNLDNEQTSFYNIQKSGTTKVFSVKPDHVSMVFKLNLPTMIILVNDKPILILYKDGNNQYRDGIAAQVGGDVKIGHQGELVNNNPKTNAAKISHKIRTRDQAAKEALLDADDETREVLNDTILAAKSKVKSEYDAYQKDMDGGNDPELTGSKEKLMNKINDSSDNDLKLLAGVVQMDLDLATNVDSKNNKPMIIDKVSSSRQKSSLSNFFEQTVTEKLSLYKIKLTEEESSEFLDFNLEIIIPIDGKFETNREISSEFLQKKYQKSTNDTGKYIGVEYLSDLNKHHKETRIYYDFGTMDQDNYSLIIFNFKSNDKNKISESSVKKDIDAIYQFVDKYKKSIVEYFTKYKDERVDEANKFNVVNIDYELLYKEMWSDDDNLVRNYANQFPDRLKYKNKAGYTPAVYALHRKKYKLYQDLHDLNQEPAWEGVQDKSVLHIVIENNIKMLGILAKLNIENFRKECSFESGSLGTPLYYYLSTLNEGKNNFSDIFKQSHNIIPDNAPESLLSNSNPMQGLGSDSSLLLSYRKKLFYYTLYFIQSKNSFSWRINAEEDTILHLVASKEKFSTIRIIFDMVDNKKDLSIANAKGHTPIISAIFNNEEGTAVELIRHYKDLILSSITKKMSPFLAAVRMNKKTVAFELLKINKEFINDSTEDGKNVWAHVAETGNLSMLLYLIEFMKNQKTMLVFYSKFDASVIYKTIDGVSPLHLCLNSASNNFNPDDAYIKFISYVLSMESGAFRVVSGDCSLVSSIIKKYRIQGLNFLVGINKDLTSELLLEPTNCLDMVIKDYQMDDSRLCLELLVINGNLATKSTLDFFINQYGQNGEDNQVISAIILDHLNQTQVGEKIEDNIIHELLEEKSLVLGCFDIVRKIIEWKPESLIRKGQDNFTPLHIAVKKENLELVKALVLFNNQSIFDAENNVRKNAIELAEETKNKEIIDFLKEFRK